MFHSWAQAAIVTCLFGFFKELKPSASFMTPYLNSTYKQINIKDINDRIYPVRTYAELIFLVVVFLSTDLLRYKSFIVLESLARLTAAIFLCFENGIPMMQVMQAAVGIGDASEIVYYSYIYTVVNEVDFQKVTVYTRAAVLFGRGMADVLGQSLISTKTTSYLVLNYISLGSISCAVIISLTLPNPKKNIFVSKSPSYVDQVVENSNDGTVESITPNHQPIDDGSVEPSSRLSCCRLWKFKTSKIYQEFKKSFQHKELLIWSVWWALSECGSSHVENYVMNLWAVIGSDKEVYNGAVFAIGTLTGGLMIVLFQFFKTVRWKNTAEVLISTVSIFMAALLFVMARTTVIWVAYLCHILFRTLHVLILTISRYFELDYFVGLFFFFYVEF